MQRQSYMVNRTEVANLIAELPGKSTPSEILVLGAHYDTVETSPGADDNASAVAVMLEVARLLRGRQFRRTIRIVGFTCEEPPYFYTGDMGSQVYARACRERGEHIIGMLCLEMLGYFRDEPDSQQIPSEILYRRFWPVRASIVFWASSPSSQLWSWPPWITTWA